MILFVCTGNTCRSPMAKALYKKLTGKEADSMGIFANDGDKASKEAINVMEKYGIDLNDHVSKGLDLSMLQKADVVITMTERHKELLLSFVNDYRNKIFTLYEWAGKNGDVKDPFGGDFEVYLSCAKELEELIIEGEKIHTCIL